MGGHMALVAVAVAIPLFAALVVLLGDAGISERHHSHHDTYITAGSLTWTLVLAMIFMGALGVLLGWLCIVGVFHADPSVVMAFFDAFLVVSFIYWIMLRRYKVVTYDDRMDVTPFFGRSSTVSYDEISAMEWEPSLLIPSTRNIRVYVGHRRRALLWGGLDLDQILIRINRFDVLENLSGRH